MASIEDIARQIDSIEEPDRRARLHLIAKAISDDFAPGYRANFNEFPDTPSRDDMAASLRDHGYTVTPPSEADTMTQAEVHAAMDRAVGSLPAPDLDADDVMVEDVQAGMAPAEHYTPPCDAERGTWAWACAQIADAEFVRREIWEPGAGIFTDGVRVVHRGTGGNPYIVSHDDLLATDWRLADAPAPNPEDQVPPATAAARFEKGDRVLVEGRVCEVSGETAEVDFGNGADVQYHMLDALRPAKGAGE